MSKTASSGTHSAYELTFSREPSNRCGVTMSASVEGNIIADVMSKKPNVKITRFPAIIRIDGERMLEFDMEEIGEALGLEPGEYSVSAARQLQPVWSQPKLKVLRFEDAYERARHRFASILSKLGLELPKEVQL